MRPSEVDHSCSSLIRLKSEDEERLVKKKLHEGPRPFE